MCLSCLPLFASLSPPKNINVVASLTPSIQAWPLKERVGWNRALKSYASSTLSVLWGSVKRWWGLSAANNLDLKAEVKAWFTPVALLNCSYSQLGWWCGLPWEGLWIAWWAQHWNGTSRKLRQIERGGFIQKRDVGELVLFQQQAWKSGQRCAGGGG